MQRKPGCAISTHYGRDVEDSYTTPWAAVAELVDAPGLGPGAERREGSSPFGRTTRNPSLEQAGIFS
ncbi:MAG: hypothetical protein RL539_38 [Pseudomonadota bacterium]